MGIHLVAVCSIAAGRTEVIEQAHFYRHHVDQNYTLLQSGLRSQAE